MSLPLDSSYFLVFLVNEQVDCMNPKPTFQRGDELGTLFRIVQPNLVGALANRLAARNRCRRLVHRNHGVPSAKLSQEPLDGTSFQ